MQNATTASTSPHPSHLPATPLPGRKQAPGIQRKRGAQPANRNAFKHGLYSSHTSAHDETILAGAMDYRELMQQDPGSAGLLLQPLREEIDLTSHLIDRYADTPMYLPLIGKLIITVEGARLASITSFKYDEKRADLLFIASRALDLVLEDFYAHGITNDTDSFLGTHKKSDLNSLPFRETLFPYLDLPAYPFIPDEQWELISPLIPPHENETKRGRPPADARELLDAIFWKQAYTARWQDLPWYYPPMLTCRRYYRRLFRTGRLATIYHRLYKDFVARGSCELTAMLEQGCFFLENTTVILDPSLNENWELRTGLLFMQQAYRSYRRLLRQQERILASVRPKSLL